jgi:pyrroline-5-carboxylate reductase
MKKIAIIGAGHFGSAIVTALSEKGAEEEIFVYLQFESITIYS